MRLGTRSQTRCHAAGRSLPLFMHTSRGRVQVKGRKHRQVCSTAEICRPYSQRVRPNRYGQPLWSLSWFTIENGYLDLSLSIWVSVRFSHPRPTQVYGSFCTLQLQYQTNQYCPLKPMDFDLISDKITRWEPKIKHTFARFGKLYNQEVVQRISSGFISCRELS